MAERLNLLIVVTAMLLVSVLIAIIVIPFNRMWRRGGVPEGKARFLFGEYKELITSFTDLGVKYTSVGVWWGGLAGLAVSLVRIAPLRSSQEAFTIVWAMLGTGLASGGAVGALAAISVFWSRVVQDGWEDSTAPASKGKPPGKAPSDPDD